MQLAPYLGAANAFIASDDRHIGLTHVNLQIDNGFFWTADDGTMEAGLLDWGGAERVPYTQAFMGMLSGAEAEVPPPADLPQISRRSPLDLPPIYLPISQAISPDLRCCWLTRAG